VIRDGKFVWVDAYREPPPDPKALYWGKWEDMDCNPPKEKVEIMSYRRLWNLLDNGLLAWAGPIVPPVEENAAVLAAPKGVED
jgi:hypothetical protein